MTFFLKNRGFTLIELIVALGLFSIIMVITTGGFVRFLKTERQALSFVSVNNNLGAAIEQMAKEIRTGKNFCTNGQSCQSPDVLSFVNSKGVEVPYCLESGAGKRNEGQDCSSGQEITGSKVSVGYLNFIVSDNDNYPPRITILIGANPNNESASIYTANLQTTVSSRQLGG